MIVARPRAVTGVRLASRRQKTCPDCDCQKCARLERPAVSSVDGVTVHACILSVSNSTHRSQFAGRCYLERYATLYYSMQWPSIQLCMIRSVFSSLFVFAILSLRDHAGSLLLYPIFHVWGFLPFPPSTPSLFLQHFEEKERISQYKLCRLQIHCAEFTLSHVTLLKCCGRC